MRWKTALSWVKGVLSAVGVIAGIAAIARSSAFGRELAGYLSNSGSPQPYQGIQSQAAQEASDLVQANLVFFDSVRMILLFGGLAMICFFGIILAEELKKLPVDVLVDTRGVDGLKRRTARAAERLARRLDPDEPPQVVRTQEVLPEAASLEFATVETAEPEEVLTEAPEQAGTAVTEQEKAETP